VSHKILVDFERAVLHRWRSCHTVLLGRFVKRGFSALPGRPPSMRAPRPRDGGRAGGRDPPEPRRSRATGRAAGVTER
jgi:hypothetical protein